MTASAIDRIVARIRELARIEESEEDGRRAIKTVLMNTRFIMELLKSEGSAAAIVDEAYRWHEKTRTDVLKRSEHHRAYRRPYYLEQSRLIGYAIASVRDAGLEEPAPADRRPTAPMHPRPELDEGREETASADGRPAAASQPTPPRLELDEDRQRFRIDDDWHDYVGERITYALRVLLEARGQWLAARELERPEVFLPRFDRILAMMPQEVQEIIESRQGPAGGYRIKLEYFE